MKASSLLKHIWVGSFICALFLTATGVAYAGANNTGTNGKTEVCTQQELAVKQNEQAKKKIAAVAVPKQNEVAKPAPKQTTEVKKEDAPAGFFSFSFIYYLFYKTNFAESTNHAFKTTLKAFVDKLIG